MLMYRGSRSNNDALYSVPLYFVECRADSGFDEADLMQLLQADCRLDGLDFEQGFCVVPRLGTVSPWSTKASEIARLCHFSGVARIEHGRFVRPDDWCELNRSQRLQAMSDLHDPLTESALLESSDVSKLFEQVEPQSLCFVPLLQDGMSALEKANTDMGLALSEQERHYLFDAYQRLERDPTDVELMMFAQVNSEHCRHKIFNALNSRDGKALPHSLFDMIRNTHRQHPGQVAVAYSDNAAVVKGVESARFYADPESAQYRYQQEQAHYVFKVETHNHPTAISPFSGAATGSGGEIRDEAATGRGAQAKAGLCGFSVSYLNIPGWSQPWEHGVSKPENIASALKIMCDGPIGAASFNNEFGRPNLCGYFRCFEHVVATEFGEKRYGYHKPIMIAGGLGQIREPAVYKQSLHDGALLIVLGGPGMPIGLGGGAASSVSSGANAASLDFASVQRANPEMQRRAQEVINSCWALGERNPIISVHDVGAGGLSNAMPELVEADDLGAWLDLRKIPSDASGMSPLEIWCNESQERYVLAISEKDLELFTQFCQRERCPMAVVGKATINQELEVSDAMLDQTPVNLPMDVLFEKIPPLERDLKPGLYRTQPIDFSGIALPEAIKRVLQFPAVADKSFLITIGDRSVTGLVARDQMVGPWQVPVSDVAVMANSYQGYQGEAMAMGERAPIAMLHHAASARMAVGEAITNLAAARISSISDIVLSANWMAAADAPGEGDGLYQAVQAVGLELCPALGIAIPVGKDSLSMRTQWQHNGEARQVTSPLSLVISASASVTDIRRTLTPELRSDCGGTALLLIDLSEGELCLGASVLAQVYQQLGDRPADIDNPALLKSFFEQIQQLNHAGEILAYHDRSDGGLLATVCEMMFAGHVGVSLNMDYDNEALYRALFSEELGAVIQVRESKRHTIMQQLEQAGLHECVHTIGYLNDDMALHINQKGERIYAADVTELHQCWSETSYRLQALRDNPDCAQQAFDELARSDRSGIKVHTSFDLNEDVSAPFINVGVKPKCAILREQGVNGHVEMAMAFDQAGFDAVDVHMSDLLSGRFNLSDFHGLAACGGFSYGDVLGAGRGWAQSILHHQALRQQFSDYFSRDNTFTLGVCNGCQMLSQLQTLIPGSDHWPVFTANQSQQFEARLVSVEVKRSASIVLNGMEGSIIPVVVAHGEGKAELRDQQYKALEANQQVSLAYVDDQGQATTRYPYNPNGSIAGVTGLTSQDGRVTIMMPHPERVVRTVQLSWHPSDWPQYSPWMRLFRNARQWLA